MLRFFERDPIIHVSLENLHGDSWKGYGSVAKVSTFLLTLRHFFPTHFCPFCDFLWPVQVFSWACAIWGRPTCRLVERVFRVRVRVTWVSDRLFFVPLFFFVLRCLPLNRRVSQKKIVPIPGWVTLTEIAFCEQISVYIYLLSCRLITDPFS